MTTAQTDTDFTLLLTHCHQLIHDNDSQGITQFIAEQHQLTAQQRDALLEQLRIYWLEKQNPNSIPNFDALSYSEQRQLTRERASLHQSLLVGVLAFGLLSKLTQAWKVHLSGHLFRILEDGYQQLYQNQSQNLFPSMLELLVELKPNFLNDCISWMNPYLMLRYLEKQQLIQYNADIFIKSLFNTTIYHRNDASGYSDRNLWQLVLQSYSQDEVIYQRDIPQVFQQSSHIHLNTVDFEEEQFSVWQRIILHLLAQQKIPREEVIQHILNIQHYDWDKKAQAFFMQLLAQMQLSTQEYLQHQDDLFNLLQHTEKSQVSLAMTLLQPLIGLEHFKFEDYLSALNNVMYRSDFKVGIRELIKQLSQALSLYPQYQMAILTTLSSGLIQQDSKIQLSIAKLLVQHLKAQPNDLTALMTPYQDHLMADAKLLLAPYFVQNQTIQAITTDLSVREAPQSILSTARLDPTQKIELPQTWQDLLFLMAEPIKENNLFNLDLMFSAWLKLQADFPQEYQKQLKPIFKILGKITNHTPINIFQRLWLDYLEDPSRLSTDMKYFDSHAYLRNHIALSRYFLFFFDNFVQLATSQQAVVLLSLPTHQPSFIDPEILLQRIIQYQEKNLHLNPWDFALAIARTPRENPQNSAAAAVYLKQISCPHTQNIVTYILGEISQQQALALQAHYDLSDLAQYQWHTLWQVALDTHHHEENLHAELNFLQLRAQYHYITRSNENHATLQSSQANLYRYLRSHKYSTGVGLNECVYRHLSPINNFANDFAHIEEYCLAQDNLSPVPEPLLHTLSQPNYDFNAASYLMLACYSFHASAMVRRTVADTLNQCFTKMTLNLEQLAQHYHVLMLQDYAPLNRLIDCFSQTKGFSVHTDHQLMQLLAAILQIQPQPEKLPKQFAKLFELYYELQSLNAQSLSPMLIESLKLWEKNFKPLKEITQKILAKQ